jgi:predicted PurR-regulated permease PerM
VLGRASDALQHLGRGIAQGDNKQDRQEGLAPDTARPVPVKVQQSEWAFLDRYRSILESLFEPLSVAAIVLVYLVFIMLYREDLRDRFIRLMGVKNVQRSTAALDDAGSCAKSLKPDTRFHGKRTAIFIESGHLFS